MSPTVRNRETEDDVVWLLRLASSVSSSAEPLSDRRQRVLEQVGQRIGADGGWWVWGQGHPKDSRVVPLAMLIYGYTTDQMMTYNAGVLTPNMWEIFQKKVIERLTPEHPQTTNSVDQLIGEENWFALQEFEQFFKPMGGTRFISSARYFANEYWVACVYGRNGMEAKTFSRRELQIVDWAMAGIASMHITPDKAVPNDVLKKLTLRQSAVLTQLLDGQSRRSIAYRLKISENTVNEHVKKLFKNFDVTSISELSAKFLRSRD